jgi:hypothetical protein
MGGRNYEAIGSERQHRHAGQQEERGNQHESITSMVERLSQNRPMVTSHI